jgi:hypothetical protein
MLITCKCYILSSFFNLSISKCFFNQLTFIIYNHIGIILTITIFLTIELNQNYFSFPWLQLYYIAISFFWFHQLNLVKFCKFNFSFKTQIFFPIFIKMNFVTEKSIKTNNWNTLSIFNYIYFRIIWQITFLYHWKNTCS